MTEQQEKDVKALGIALAEIDKRTVSKCEIFLIDERKKKKLNYLHSCGFKTLEEALIFTIDYGTKAKKKLVETFEKKYPN